MTIIDSNAMRKQPQQQAPADLSESAVKFARRVASLRNGAYTITLHVAGGDLHYSVHKEGKIEKA